MKMLKIMLLVFTLLVFKFHLPSVSANVDFLTTKYPGLTLSEARCPERLLDDDYWYILPVFNSTTPVCVGRTSLPSNLQSFTQIDDACKKKHAEAFPARLLNDQKLENLQSTGVTKNAVIGGYYYVANSVMHANISNDHFVVYLQNDKFNAANLQDLNPNTHHVLCMTPAFPRFMHSYYVADPENYLEKNENLFAQCKKEYKAQDSCKPAKLPWWVNRHQWYFFCEFEGTGSLTVLLTGNSYSSFFYQSLLDAGKHKIKKLILSAAPACLIHRKTLFGAWCKDVADNLPRILVDVRPDVVIINQRYWAVNVFKKFPTDAQNDPLVDVLREDWAMISNYTKKIIIIEPASGLHEKTDLLRPLRLNTSDLSTYAIPLKAYKAEVDPGWDRVLKSVDKCPKCKLISIRSHFCDSKSCDVYDTERRLSLYCDGAHHAPTAIKRYLPSVLREIEL